MLRVDLLGLDPAWGFAAAMGIWVAVGLALFAAAWWKAR